MKIAKEELEFLVLGRESIPAMLGMQEEAFACMENTDVLRRNTADSLSCCFSPPSVSVGVFYRGEIIAFGILYAPGKDAENLAYDVPDIPDVEMSANLKLAIVRPAYRGNGIQRMLIGELERHAVAAGMRYLCSTVSPLNRYSRDNLLAAGYRIVKRLEKYGGLQRDLFSKRIG